MSNNEINIGNIPVACPECGRTSDSLKCYSLPNYMVFLGVYLGYSFQKKVCCPHCMRKNILIKYFTYNIIIGNLFWLAIGLPMGIWKLCSSYTKGHSQTVRDILAENSYEPAYGQTEPAPGCYDEGGAPIYNQKYDIQID